MVTTYHIMLLGSASLGHLHHHLFLAMSAVLKYALMRRIVGIDGLQQRINRCKQAGQQRQTTGSPKTFHQTLIALNHEDSQQELLRHLFRLAVGQTPGRVWEPTSLHRAC